MPQRTSRGYGMPSAGIFPNLPKTIVSTATVRSGRTRDQLTPTTVCLLSGPEDHATQRKKIARDSASGSRQYCRSTRSASITNSVIRGTRYLKLTITHAAVRKPTTIETCAGARSHLRRTDCASESPAQWLFHRCSWSKISLELLFSGQSQEPDPASSRADHGWRSSSTNSGSPSGKS